MDKEKFIKQLKVYLRDYDVDFTKEELDYFLSLNLQKKSYLVISEDYNMLKKFINTFLTSTNNDYYDYIAYNVNEYVSEKTENNITYAELLIISYPKFTNEYGKSGEYIKSVLLDTVVSRNRVKNQYTLILAEKELPYFSDSGEIEILRLDNKFSKNSKNNNESSMY